MVIQQHYIEKNEFSRPAREIKEVLGIVMHWTANPVANAQQNRDYFNSLQNGRNGYASAHYVVGQNGDIVACIPEKEIAYHCGSSTLDPESGKVYTNEARRRYGNYASIVNSPNNCTIGIELCPLDAAGHFTEMTLQAAAELCADICIRYGLVPHDVTTHYNVVGWKKCPLLWADDPRHLELFRTRVKDCMIEHGR